MSRTWIAQTVVVFGVLGLIWLVRDVGPRDRTSCGSLVLVTIDTLRADAVGAYGSRGVRTPVLDRLAREGVAFERAFTPVPVTLPAHATILTGQLPTRHGVRGNSFYALDPAVPTLATILAGQGYDTAAFIGAAVLDHRFGLARGFARYDDEMPTGNGETLIAERRAAAVVDRAVAWLASRDRTRPFFLWVHLFDPHHPYRPPEGQPTAATPYLGEVAYADQEVGRLLQAVETGAKCPLVVVTSDHGESLGEHGEATHGVLLYDATLRVPLIVHGPGIVPADVRPRGVLAGLADILPTVLGRLGIPAPTGLDGLDLLGSDLASREWLYAETYLPRDFYEWSELRAVRSTAWKFVLAPLPELYDLEADPGELRNQVDTHPERARAFERVLEDRFAAIGKARPVGLQLPPGLSDRLRSLGYAAAGAPRPRNERQPSRPDPKTRIYLVDRLDRALALARADPAAAVSELQRILEVDPPNFLARHTLADSLFAANRDDEAKAAYGQLVADGRESAYYRFRLATLHERQHEWTGAAREFGHLVAVSPDTRADVEDRAGRLLKQGEARGAIAYFEALAQSAPLSADSSIALGMARLEAGEPAKACKGLRQALAADAQHDGLRAALVRSLNAQGIALDAAGEAQAARNAFVEAVTLAPADFDSLANLGLADVRAGRSQEALPTLVKALDQRPHEVRLLNLVAELRFRRGEHDAASQLLERSLSIDPEQPRIVQVLAEVRRHLRR